MSAPVIDVSGLNVSFRDSGGYRRVVSDVEFAVHSGECLALVGESGSGKSVTSRSLVGLAGDNSLVEADRLEIEGADVLRNTESQWRDIRGSRLGFVLQDALASLDSLRHVGAEVAEPLRLHTDLSSRERDARVIELLRDVGVPEPELRARQRPFELSGGLRQRALIASAIAAGPRILIADEPTTALDATIAAQILRLLETLKRTSGAMLMISHDLSVVSRIADRIAVMKAGVIVEQGDAEQVLFDPKHDYTKQLLAAIPSEATRGSRLSDTSPAGRTSSRATSALESRASAGAPLIEALGLSKTYRGPDGRERVVLKDMSFAVHRGETLGIVGESGSGKTTAARLILGAELPSSGSVFLGGVEVATLSRRHQRELRRGVQAVHQDPLGSFDPRYTVRKVLDEALRVARVPRGSRMTRSFELLDLVRLLPATIDRRPLELSGGQRQRVAIARALALDPAVIIADEAVSALDVSVQAQILDLLGDVQDAAGVALLFISHDLGVIHHVTDRVLVMKDGSIVESGDVEHVFTCPSAPYTRTLLDAIPHIETARASRIGASS
ncbi:MAG: dipeptide ABC transporter ATP-binding protein [Microbacterium gubbeenense]|uniref:dipeptide ABC transporter ATP-binding protein n=1 Tax=Microbacterium gubbeenense TaxID=159896 RepID=UPI003F96A3E5